MRHPFSTAFGKERIIGWNQGNVDTLMRHIGTGMKPGSLIEVALFLGALAVLFFVYKTYYHRIEQGWLKRRRALADRKFDEAARLQGLLPSDRDLLLALASFLPEPDQQKHLLLSDPVTFDTARRDYLAEHPRHTERLLALRVKLDHPSKHSGRALHSTTEIPPGTLLFGTTNESQAATDEPPPRYRIRDIQPDALLVECLQDKPAPGASETLDIQRPDGHYSFPTRVLDTSEDTARLQHSYHLKRRQNRRYVRRDVFLEGRIDRHATRVVNLSGGGARLHGTPGILRRYKAGQPFTFTLWLFPGKGIETKAHAVEVKPDHGILRLAFTRIRESDRDRIIKFVLKESPAGQSPPPESDSPLAPAS